MVMWPMLVKVPAISPCWYNLLARKDSSSSWGVWNLYNDRLKGFNRPLTLGLKSSYMGEPGILRTHLKKIHYKTSKFENNSFIPDNDGASLVVGAPSRSYLLLVDGEASLLLEELDQHGRDVLSSHGFWDSLAFQSYHVGDVISLGPEDSILELGNLSLRNKKLTKQVLRVFNFYLFLCVYLISLGLGLGLEDVLL